MTFLFLRTFFQFELKSCEEDHNDKKKKISDLEKDYEKVKQNLLTKKDEYQTLIKQISEARLKCNDLITKMIDSSKNSVIQSSQYNKEGVKLISTPKTVLKHENIINSPPKIKAQTPTIPKTEKRDEFIKQSINDDDSLERII